jgi:DNA-binding MarR family transcriptional regulator
MDDAEAMREFAELFKATYLRFHRRRQRDAAYTGQQWAVLTHLALTGPLTVGECAQHLERAQSVVSEIIDGMEKRGLLERMRDARDRRRVLVWLSEAGQRALEKEQQVLDAELLARAASALTASEKKSLLSGIRALVRAADHVARTRRNHEQDPV